MAAPHIPTQKSSPSASQNAQKGIQGVGPEPTKNFQNTSSLCFHICPMCQCSFSEYKWIVESPFPSSCLMYVLLICFFRFLILRREV